MGTWIKPLGAGDASFPTAAGYISVEYGVGGAIMGSPNIFHLFKSGGEWHASYLFNKDETRSFKGLVSTGDPEADFPLLQIATQGPLVGYYIDQRQIVKSEYVTQVSASGTLLDNCGSEE